MPSPSPAVPNTPLAEHLTIHPVKDSLGESSTCRCFDSAQCSHVAKISKFFARDVRLSTLKTGEFSANSPVKSSSNPSGAGAASPGDVIGEVSLDSVMGSVIRETEKLLMGFEERKGNCDNLMSPLMPVEETPGSSSQQPAGSARNYAQSQKRQSLSNTDVSVSQPIGSFQARFFNTPAPPLGNFFPGETGGGNGSRPHTAPSQSGASRGTAKTFDTTSNTSNAPWLHTKGTPNYRLKKISTVTEEWFKKYEDNVLFGFKTQQEQLQEEKFKDEKTRDIVFTKEEADRVQRHEENEASLTSIIQSNEKARVSEKDNLIKLGQQQRASELYSTIDGAEEDLLEEELKFEREVRDTEDNKSNLGNRGILTLKMSNTRMQSLEEVSAKVKLSSVWEDALFWLTSCGEAAVVKQCFEEEVMRVGSVVKAEAELVEERCVDENDRVKESLMKSYNDLLNGYDGEKSTMLKLNKVCVALSKGCNEVIARQLRSNLKSNDVPEDRVKLFWEIKNSVDRFKSRGQEYVHDGKVSLSDFKSFKKGCINALSDFKKKILTKKAKGKAAEKARVGELVETTEETFGLEVGEESARVEAEYNETINKMLQSRYTASNRFQHYITQTQLSRTSTLELSSAIYSSSVESRGMLQGNYENFQRELEGSLEQHAELVRVLSEGARGEVENHLKNLNLRLYSTLMTCTNVLNCQMELIHESLVGVMKSTQGGNFPLPVGGMFEEVNKVLLIAGGGTAGEVPVPVPPGGGVAEETPWVIYYDEASEHNYYYNPSTQESIWEQDATRDIIEAVEKKIAEVNPNDISGSIVSGDNAGAMKGVEGEVELEVEVEVEVEVKVEIAPQQELELSDELNEVVKGYTDNVFLLMDEFFENRIKDVYEEYKIIGSSFQRDVEAQNEDLVEEERKIKQLVQEEYAKIESALKDYARGVKDEISKFSVENSSIIENMGSSELLNGVISFWNGEEVKLGLLNNEMLDMSLPEEVYEITEGLDSTKDAMIRVKNAEYKLEKPSMFDKIARLTIASAISDDIFGVDVGEVVGLEEVMGLGIVKKLVEEGSNVHLVSTAMNSSAVKSSKDSNNLIEHNVEFDSGKFAKKLGEGLSWSSFEFTWDKNLEEVKAGVSVEVRNLVKYLTTSIENSMGGRKVGRNDLIQLLKFSEPSGYLDAGDVSLIMGLAWEEGRGRLDVGQVERVMGAVWGGKLLDAAKLVWLSEGIYGTGEEVGGDSSNEYVEEVLRGIWEGDEVCVDKLLEGILGCIELTLPKPLVIAVIARFAATSHRLPTEKHLPSYIFSLGGDHISGLTSSLCEHLRPSFFASLERESNIRRECERISKFSKLDDVLSSYEGLGDHPNRLKHAGLRARRIMDARILSSVLDGGEQWNCEEVAEGSLEVGWSAGLMGLGNFVGGSGSLSHSGPFVVSTILRRYKIGFEEKTRRKERARRPVGLWKEKDISARRIDRERKRIERVRVLAEEEVLKQVNGMRLTVLKCCNDFEKGRVEHYIDKKNGLGEELRGVEEVLQKNCDEVNVKLDKFGKEVKKNLKVQRETEISVLKSFKAASEGCVVEFNGKLGELLVETHGMVGVVRGFYGGEVKDKFFEFEGDAYERLAETTFGELEGDVKASIGSIELALKENSVKFAGLEGSFVESEDSANSKLAAALKKITDESIKLASGLVDELAVAVEEKLARVDVDIEDGRKRSMAIMAEAERSVNEKGEEEVKKVVEGGGSDRLSVISAKLNTGTSVEIMKNATAEAKNVIEISEKRVEMLNDEVKKLIGVLPDRVALIVKALEEKIENVKVKEKARADEEAKKMGEALLAFVNEQQETVGKGKREVLEGIRSCYLKKGKEVTALELKLAGNLEEILEGEMGRENGVWEGLKEGILAWGEEQGEKARGHECAGGQYEGIGASQKIGGDAVYKKEVDTRESIMGRVDGTFSELSLNNSRIVENLFLRVVSTCSGITRDLQARGERTRELGKGADLKLAEMEKVAASRREKLLEEARLKKEEGMRREREEKEELARIALEEKKVQDASELEKSILEGGARDVVVRAVALGLVKEVFLKCGLEEVLVEEVEVKKEEEVVSAVPAPPPVAVVEVKEEEKKEEEKKEEQKEEVVVVEEKKEEPVVSEKKEDVVVVVEERKEEVAESQKDELLDQTEEQRRSSMLSNPSLLPSQDQDLDGFDAEDDAFDDSKLETSEDYKKVETDLQQNSSIEFSNSIELVESIGSDNLQPVNESSLATTELIQKSIEGESYLLEVHSGKVYSNNEDQEFVGKLKDGKIDREAEDSSDDEDLHGGTAFFEESIEQSVEAPTVGRGRESMLTQPDKFNDESSLASFETASTSHLHEKIIEGKKYLVELETGKVYTVGDQIFVGKLNKYGKIDDQVDNSSSDDESDISVDLHERVGINGETFLVDISNGKCYTVVDQKFLGKIKGDGSIDREVEDSSDSESDEGE
ncbi:hypothetical protein TL16_g12481 [Triparma laevis f. inornata]|uniref:WW domain-containing protein n=1 Tax=Triparma laevis f. inornata TaxID=1714386 RepID=A0A9W7BSR0_9STRA|nr:hypothetical protein TL16_g12481 [Triparma laevis f. inornata]